MIYENGDMFIDTVYQVWTCTQVRLVWLSKTLKIWAFLMKDSQNREILFNHDGVGYEKKSLATFAMPCRLEYVLHMRNLLKYYE